MPCTIIVAKRRAITGVNGNPKLNNGIKDVCAPALFPDSAAAINLSLSLFVVFVSLILSDDCVIGNDSFYRNRAKSDQT